VSVLSLLRVFTAVLSLSVLAGAAWFLGQWLEGDWLRDGDGALVRVRPDWMLWTGLALLTWSVLGWLIAPLVLARPDARPLAPRRGRGQTAPVPGGAGLHIETHGKAGAPPVIFTHGWGLDSSTWAYAVEDLGDRFSLVTWDLAGLGRSRRGKGRPLSLDVMAADLDAVLDVAAGRKAVLVGHSIGGMIIQTLARRRPEAFARVAGVVLLNTTYTNPLRTMIFSRLLLALQKPLLEPLEKLTIALHPVAWLLKWQSWLSGSTHIAMRFGFGRHVTRSQLKHVALLVTKAPPAVEAQGNLAMMNWDSGGALARMGVPVLIIGGDVDIVTKLEASQALSNEVPRSELMTMEGANHLAPLECAEAINAAIAEFVLEVQRAEDADRAPQNVEAGENAPRRDRPGTNQPSMIH